MRRKLIKYLQRSRTKPLDPLGERAYTIGDFAITLPNSHLLALHQKDNPLYDRFLLSLGALKLGSWVIDIGANVGDSAAALLSMHPKRLLCIEPADDFFPLLERNARLFRDHGSEVVCVKTGVGPQGQTARLEVNVSTASLQLGGSGLTLTSLDELVARHCTDGLGVDLIKCDVDGFDAVALGSGMGVITRDQPLLYFEADITSADCLEQLKAFCKTLALAGYTQFSAFDNFGLLVAQDISVAALGDMLGYTWVLNQRQSTRTFYYLDILCSGPRQNARHLEALGHYVSRWLS